MREYAARIAYRHFFEELRKVLKLKEGELLEIYTNDKSELVFKKYNEVGATQDQLDLISKKGGYMRALLICGTGTPSAFAASSTESNSLQVLIPYSVFE